jgi:hypothetical protein
MLAAVDRRKAYAGGGDGDCAVLDGRWLPSHNGRVDRTTPAIDGTAGIDVHPRFAAHIFARGPDQLGATVTDVARRDPLAVPTR